MSDWPPDDRAPTIELEAPWDPPPGFVPASGAVIGGAYEVRSVLGTGGMGAVLRCWDRGLARDVAVKLIHPDRMESTEARARFLSEARTMARIHHPNVVEIHAFGEHDRAPYFVMEYVPGTDLAAWLKARRGSLTRNKAVDVIDRIAQGLSAIHAAGAVHRDLKPANVLVGPDFRLVVGDLGLAQSMGSADPAGTRSVCGTPRYMAPELLTRSAEEQTSAVDAYALGIMAYEMVTGGRPFDAMGGLELLTQHVYEDPLPPRHFDPTLPEAVSSALLLMLAKEPSQRPAVAAFRRALNQAVADVVAPHLVLIADDDPGCRQTTADVLGEAFPGARFVLAEGGRAALESAFAEPPSIAVLDLHMPHVSGADVALELRADPRTEHVPIVVLSGVGGARDWQKLKAVGVHAFLVKPVDADALVAAVRRALESAR